VKPLIVEDDFVSRVLLQEYLKGHGTCHIAVNGLEAITAVGAALEAGDPYDLICLDIMMPVMDGHDALTAIRQLESAASIPDSRRVRVVMMTALADSENVQRATQSRCDYYLVKPIQRTRLFEELRRLRLVR